MSVGYLYVTSNDKNDVLYVGQSSKTDEQTLAAYMGSGDYFRSALAEIGREHFTKTIVRYCDEQGDLDYGEVHLIAKYRAEGITLYNGGVGGPRAQQPFVLAMLHKFGVFPQSAEGWFRAIEDHADDVKKLISAGVEIDTSDFYWELERQLKQTQNLSGACLKCGSPAGSVCRTRTGNPSRNHAGRPVER